FAHLHDALPRRLARLARGKRQLLDAAPRRDRGMVQDSEGPARVFAGSARARQTDSACQRRRHHEPTDDSPQSAPLWRPCGLRSPRDANRHFRLQGRYQKRERPKIEPFDLARGRADALMEGFSTPVRAADRADAAALAGAAASGSTYSEITVWRFFAEDRP